MSSTMLMKLRYLSGTGLLCQQRFWQHVPDGIACQAGDDQPMRGRQRADSTGSCALPTIELSERRVLMGFSQRVEPLGRERASAGPVNMLPVEAHRAGLCLDGWFSHSHENPSRCITIEHGAQSADFMMALSTLSQRRRTTACFSWEEVMTATGTHGVRRADLRLRRGSSLSILGGSKPRRKAAHEARQLIKGTRKQS